MKLAAFDIEIAKEIPAGVKNWQKYEPLGISCAALAANDEKQVRIWKGMPKMDREGCLEIVSDLNDFVERGYTLLTWNGCKFDFNVLAQETGLYTRCAEMAKNHYDLMLMVTFTQGHFLSLQAALEGSGLKGKLKNVTLKNGRVLTGMDGALAPRLWKAGEYEAVLAYLREDVTQLLELASVTVRNRALRWISRSGNFRRMPVERLLTVHECFLLPEPDVSWSFRPPSRSGFIDWMPVGIRESLNRGAGRI
ncbi:MAG: ribonuclease H-like domain-containing protein [Anaerolineales bacterium]|jgi:hypothetical protein